MLKQVGAVVDGIINVKILNGARRACDQTIGSCQDDGGTIIIIGEARSHDSDDATMPTLVEDHGALGITKHIVGINHAQSLFGDAVVELTAFVIEVVDGSRQFLGMIFLVSKQQTHRVGGLGDTSRRIDARTDKEDQIADSQLSGQHILVFIQLVFITTVDVGMLQDGFNTWTWFFVQLLQPEISQHTVLACDGHDVGSDAYSQQVEQFIHLFGGAQTLHGERSNQLEAHATARKFIVRIVAIRALGIEHRHSVGDDITSTVVVTDDEVDTTLVGIFNAFHRLDAAVEGND